MKITKLIETLKRELAKHGDVEVYVDMDYGQRQLDEDDKSSYEKATKIMPERIVL